MPRYEMFRNSSVIFLQILLMMENNDKRIFILTEPMSRFPFQQPLTATSAAENVRPKLYTPLHKNGDNGKMEGVKVPCCQKVPVQRGGALEKL